MKKVLLFIAVFICFLALLGYSLKNIGRAPAPTPSSWNSFETADGVSKNLQTAFSSFLQLFQPIPGTVTETLTNTVTGLSNTVSSFYSDMSKPGFFNKLLGAAEFALVMPLKIVIWVLLALVYLLNFIARVSLFVMGYLR